MIRICSVPIIPTCIRSTEKNRDQPHQRHCVIPSIIIGRIASDFKKIIDLPVHPFPLKECDYHPIGRHLYLSQLTFESMLEHVYPGLLWKKRLRRSNDSTRFSDGKAAVRPPLTITTRPVWPHEIPPLTRVPLAGFSKCKYAQTTKKKRTLTVRVPESLSFWVTRRS